MQFAQPARGRLGGRRRGLEEPKVGDLFVKSGIDGIVGAAELVFGQGGAPGQSA